jgi:hypothetical protein
MKLVALICNEIVRITIVASETKGRCYIMYHHFFIAAGVCIV